MDDEILLMIDNTSKTLFSVMNLIESNTENVAKKIEHYIQEQAPGDLIFVGDREQAIMLRTAIANLQNLRPNEQEKYWEEVADYYIQKHKEGFS